MKLVTATLSIDELLAQSPWFVALDDAAKTRVRPDIVERAVDAGQSLGRHGERQQMWFGVLEGQTVTLGGQSMGSWFGEGTLVRNAPRESDLIALRDSRVAQMPRATFVWLRENRPSFNEFLLQQINERLHWFMGAVAAHGLLDTDSLVARALVGMVQPLSNPSGTVHLPLSQEELANLAALSRQTCNKAMTRFKRAGLVRTEYGGIVVLDLPGLNALSR
jgi:CRP-like cAMP-binding protein